MIKREIFSDLKEHLASKEITLITGPRQCGKTTLMTLLMEDLEKEGKPFVYLNLDLESDFNILRSQENLVQYLQLNLGTESKSYVFIDEIQRKTNAGIFLKGIYDSDLPYKFIVSGSGSVELKEKISEGLAGRKKTFKVGTISFKEFVSYKTDYKYEANLSDYLNSPFFTEAFLEEYLYFGGYPKLITSETKDQKKDVLASIYESYVTKDLRELLNLQRTDAIGDLLTFLSTRIGRITSISEISNRINLSYATVKQYLYYLEETFQIEVARPFSTNPESEITKSPNYYFSDLGMRNFVFNRISHYDPIISGPMLFQNFVYLLLSKNSLVSKINYWRTKDGAEMDLIANIGSIRIPVEVKFQNLHKGSISRSMQSFIAKYTPPKMFVVNRSLSTDVMIGETRVFFVPYRYLLTDNWLQ